MTESTTTSDATPRPLQSTTLNAAHGGFGEYVSIESAPEFDQYGDPIETFPDPPTEPVELGDDRE